MNEEPPFVWSLETGMRPSGRQPEALSAALQQQLLIFDAVRLLGETASRSAYFVPRGFVA